MERRALHLLAIPGLFAVCKLPPADPVPTWATKANFFSIPRSQDELSVVCPEDVVPVEVRSENGWRCLRVAGTIDFPAIGVLASLVSPLAENGISVFAISTFDTDYLLVQEKDWPATLTSLKGAGHTITDEPSPERTVSPVAARNT